MTAALPLVGREPELRAIASAMSDSKRNGVVVAGAAGVGKTRLVREAVVDLDPRRFYLAQAVASSASSAIPFGALAHLLPNEAVAAGPMNLLGWAREAILGVVDDDRRLVLSVDDAQLLDEASAAVVLHLARTSDAFVLVTVRPSEPEPDAVQALWKDELLDRVELAPLSLENTAEVIRATLGGDVETATVHRLWRVTEGNPLYVREMVLAGRLAGKLAPRHGLFRWIGELAMAPRLAELIGARLGELDEDEATVLELVAFGEPISVSMLAELGPPSAVDAVEARKLITVEPDGQRIQARLAHPLYGEAVRATCPELRSRQRMRELADAVEAVGARRPEDTLRVALWRLNTGTAHDPDQLLAACRIASSANDMPLATRLGWAAVNTGGGVDAATTLATILNWNGRPEEAEAALTSVESDVGSEADRAKLTTSRAFTLWHGQQRADEALRLLADVERTIQDDSVRHPVIVRHIELAQMSGRCREALQLFDELMSGPPATEAVCAQARSLAGQSFGVTGQYAAAIECLDQAMAAVSLLRENDPVAEARTVAVRHHVHLIAGDLDAADAGVRPVYTRAVEEWDWSFVFGFMSWCRGQVARCRGQGAQARRWCQEAVAVLRQQSVAGFGPSCLGDLAHTYALVGDLTAATSALAQADGERSSSMGLYNHWIDIARPWVLACGGDVSTAVEHALETASRAHDTGLVGFEIIAAHDAVRLGAADRVAERLQAAAAQAEGPYPPLCVEHAVAVVSGDGDGLLTVADEFSNLGMLLHAAEAAAQAAAVFRASGRAARSRAAAARAWSLAQRCEGARTPALAELRAPGLSRSEQEVAHLAAAGLTSREIADRLAKSVRTVDNQLGNVYNKLGIDTRHELAGLLADSSSAAQVE